MRFRFKFDPYGYEKEIQYRCKACVVWAGIDENHGIKRNFFGLTDIGFKKKKEMRRYVDPKDRKAFDRAKPVLMMLEDVHV
jgi:hypothetical protein